MTLLHCLLSPSKSNSISSAKPEHLLLHSWKPAIGLCPVHTLILFLNEYFYPLPMYVCLMNSLFPSFFPTNILHILLILHACHMSHQSNPPWFYHPNTWWKVKLMELFITQYCLSSRHFLSLGQNILHATQFTNIFNQCPCHRVRDPDFIPI